MTEINENLPPQILSLLSKRGLASYYPKKGILAQAAEAKGKEYNATIGTATEEDGSLMLLPSVEKIADISDQAYNYLSSYGRDNLRNLWKKKLIEKNPSLEGKKFTTPVVTSALTHGLNLAGYLFMDETDELILPDMYWSNYKIILTGWCGAQLKTFKYFNLEDFKEKLMQGGEKKVVLLNFPNNPTGYTPTEEELSKITKILLEAVDSGKKIAVICDDAYFGLVFEEEIPKESLFTRIADIHENILAIKVDGPTKEDYVWGLRVGFLTYAYKGMTDEAGAVLEEKTAGAIRGNISNVSNVAQSLIMKAYLSETYEQEKQEKFEILKSRYLKTKETITAHPEYEENFKAMPFNSGYFMCIQLREGLNAEEIRQKLLSEYDTGVITIDDRTLRIAFSSIPLDKIEQLFKNINEACS
ncbi:MAG: aminotransferase class I/II-fold pyridoxal phosphate-dependent enzyme [Patescibacteria group bacterium]|nr:aminotransferase class I/II-fold pyridoxal phosphate-dependent enzyme [Patescibacteria group bacterium]